MAFSPMLVMQPALAEQRNEQILNCMEPLGHHRNYRIYTCPLGGEKFEALSLGTHSKFGGHLDWEPVSYMDFPTPLAICPSNGFIISKSDYTDDELKKIQTIIESEAYKTLYEGKHASYYLFAKLQELRQIPDIDLWWLTLQATWEADKCGDQKKYKMYVLETIKEGKKSLETLNEDDNKFWTLNIVIPNLYRRLGEFEKAQKWLETFGDKTPKEDEIFSIDYFKRAIETLTEEIEKNNTKQVKVKRPPRKEIPNPPSDAFVFDVDEFEYKGDEN